MDGPTALQCLQLVRPCASGVCSACVPPSPVCVQMAGLNLQVAHACEQLAGFANKPVCCLVSLQALQSHGHGASGCHVLMQQCSAWSRSARD